MGQGHTTQCLDVAQLQGLTRFFAVIVRAHTFPDVVETTCESGDHIIRTSDVQTIHFIFVFVAICVWLPSRRIDFFACEFKDVGEGGDWEGGGSFFEVLESDIDNARFIGGEFGGGNKKVFFQVGFVFFRWGGDNGDIFKDGVGEGVCDVILKDNVLFEDVFGGCDDVFGFTSAGIGRQAPCAGARGRGRAYGCGDRRGCSES